MILFDKFSVWRMSITTLNTHIVLIFAQTNLKHILKFK